MTYEIITYDDAITGDVTRHIVIDRGDGSFESFPLDEDNPRYQQWVAEGNTAEVIEEP